MIRGSRVEKHRTVMRRRNRKREKGIYRMCPSILSEELYKGDGRGGEDIDLGRSLIKHAVLIRKGPNAQPLRLGAKPLLRTLSHYTHLRHANGPFTLKGKWISFAIPHERKIKSTLNKGFNKGQEHFITIPAFHDIWCPRRKLKPLRLLWLSWGIWQRILFPLRIFKGIMKVILHSDWVKITRCWNKSTFMAWYIHKKDTQYSSAPILFYCWRHLQQILN